jgi:hypothetical protein
MTQLTTRNAQVMTATVEIQTLTVSNKQVTLALFRQLPDKPLVKGDGELNGQPWGWVNYHPDRHGCEVGGHLHVVWQDGEQLCRARVDRPDRPDALFYPDGAEDLVQALYCLNGHQYPPTLSRVHVEDRVRFTVDGMPCATFNAPKTHLTSLQTVFGTATDEPCWTEVGRDKVLALICEAVEAERTERERYLATWRTLTGLPQLFIAV